MFALRDGSVRRRAGKTSESDIRKSSEGIPRTTRFHWLILGLAEGWSGATYCFSSFLLNPVWFAWIEAHHHRIGLPVLPTEVTIFEACYPLILGYVLDVEELLKNRVDDLTLEQVELWIAKTVVDDGI